ncbi:hypothetical protein RO3G_03947 [Rhizopus delemar RA 99-880]|uniref:Uncharacterized protein n=1 Tax=Rhizopus delemar (strain RA 99-880 / ATCC MYA-4621 / FGSC 9543 / NRRL 43880) TaxID=246409 RepID=I1BSR2_RHIO9|nr:hypothetical protein RO3G_03947 [Rhizopus delemar RA 99-880]|eukprot:EIE79242.1 hypothetical protein RO3G_03947 [Rhizopus delemar RA 99-880]
MAPVPTISITTPDLENKDMNNMSTVTPDSDNDFDVSKDPSADQKEIKITPEETLNDSLEAFYHQKSILLTGATGFIGKAVLWKLLHSLTDSVDKIFILLRPNRLNQNSPERRLRDDILSNKAFTSLRGSMGAKYENIIQEKVFPIFGDLTEPNLGLSDANIETIKSQVNIIFNCAGNIDGNESLDASVKTNTLGTLELFNIAKQCESISAFIHLSTLQLHSNEKNLLPLKESHSPADNLQDILDQQESLEYKPLYNSAYLYSKSLAEHILVDEIRKTPENQLFPTSIMRIASVGPSVQEPLIGWADGVNGINGTILLTSRGSKVIPAQLVDSIVDVVPVDYLARLIIGCPATLRVPTDFQLPTVSQRESRYSRSFSQSSMMSKEKMAQNPSHSMHFFPVIQHVSISDQRPLKWAIGYEAIRQYWNKAIHAQLPPSGAYFGIQRNSGGLTTSSRARIVMDSIRGYYSASSTIPLTEPPSPPADRSSKRNSNRLSRTVDKAAKLAHASPLYDLERHESPPSTTVLNLSFKELSFDPTQIIPENADAAFWFRYLTNASYGVHYFVCGEAGPLRLPTPVHGWSCAIQSHEEAWMSNNEGNGYSALQRQIKSTVFSQDEIYQRNARMILHVKNTLLQSNHNAEKSQADDVWLTDLDDSLDDWCQDNEVSHADRRMALGKWRKKVGSNDESVKVIVLNDKRVNMAIHQITQNAGVPKQTAVNEAVKILMRMSERTQLAFVWLAGCFIRSLLDDMFENVRIKEESLRAIRQSIIGKRVVYVPASKSVLDGLLVWYIAIRYQLPVPALACDETMSEMGSISDIYRLAGAYYIKRDKSKRSPLNSAVTAAYTQVLLRDHGALSFCLERSRSRTGKVQMAYPDGLVDMVIEATLQSNQSRTVSTASTASSAISRVVSSELNTPPESPSSVSSLDSLVQHQSFISNSSSISISSNQQPKQVHKDVVFVPINITYENVPELSQLIDEVLDQQPSARHKRASSNTPLPPSTSWPSSRMIRPSEAKDRRRTISDMPTQKKYGRVIFGVGPLISVQEVAEQYSESDESELVDIITKKIQGSQRKGLVVSTVSIIASIILYGRATHGVCIEGEDLDLIILTAFRLLDETKNIIIEGKEMNEDTNIRVNDHADNVMMLSYYANQIVDLFLLDSFFAVVYLSILEDTVMEDEFMDRFKFLVQLLEHEFVITWDPEEKWKELLENYEKKQILKRQGHDLLLLVNMENDPGRYEQLMYLASLIYPTVDAYWITSCSLSALEAVPMLPRSIIPLLTQWIATHLITGRRTIYREVLSTEPSRVAVDVFMSMGFLTEIKAKEKLSPDVQILLHEFGIPTSEILIELAGQNSDGGKTPVSPNDPEGMMKAVMAQIQMNRANSNMADLCQQIDSYRLGAASQRESFQNAQVFQKCLKQIKGILQTTSIVKKRQLDLPEDEANLAQLIYSLLASSVPAGDRAAKARALRRISEAYNLR